MADKFSLIGSWGTKPTSGTPSSDPAFDAAVEEYVTLDRKHFDTVALTTDNPVVVSLGGLDDAAVVILRATGAKVKATLASADGAAEVVPVDPLLIVVSREVPFTALTLTRAAGLDATVKVFLGQKA